MKVACFGESPADEAAQHMLIDRVLGIQTEPRVIPWLRSRGWPAVRDTLPKVLLDLYYQTDVDGLVVIVDSNGSPIHEASHEQSVVDDCRLCR